MNIIKDQLFYMEVLYKQQVLISIFKNHWKANNLFQKSKCRISLLIDFRGVT